MYYTYPKMFRWLETVNGSPGISFQSLQFLKEQREGAHGWKYDICAVTIDAMSLKKEIKWDPHRQLPVGYVDMGSEISSSEVASEALVVLVMGIKSAWKRPIAYFATTGVTASVQVQILRNVFDALLEINVVPVSLTLDGCSTNMSTLRQLGCSTDPYNIRSWFPLPASPLGRIYALPDPCHMIKLMRNVFSSVGTLKVSGELVKWDYVVKLHETQCRGVLAANRLSDRHINWQKQKMKVSKRRNSFVKYITDSIALVVSAI